MFGRILGALVILAATAALVVIAWPQLFGLATAPVIAQAVSLRGLMVAAGSALVVMLVIVALLARPARRFAASLAAVVLAFCLINVAVLATRGVTEPGFQTAGESDVTVLSWNTLGDAPGASVVAQLAIDTGAQVVVLPETTRELGLSIQQQLGDAGRPMQLFTTAYDEVSKARSTTVLISVGLGEYSADEEAQTTAVLPSVVATPTDGNGPTIVAVHSVAPIPGEMGNWRSDLQWLAGACSGENVIMAGDFNSTLDHYGSLATESGATIGGCTDAASAAGAAGIGTWPTALPALLGSPIDHVMATSGWRVTGLRIVQSHDGDGSDHRPILAQLSPR